MLSKFRLYFKYYIFLIIFCLISSLISLSVGSIFIPFDELIAILIHPDLNPMNSQIILELRLPRLLSAFICGGFLGLSGVLLQNLLRNPLADPYILGISSGAGLGILTGLVLGVSLWIMNLYALIGAIIVVGLLLLINFRTNQTTNTVKLLLSGVCLSAGINAGVSIILTTFSSMQIKSMMFWFMGDLSEIIEMPYLLIYFGILFILLYYLLQKNLELDILSLGQLKAQSMGINTQRLELQIYLFASLSTVIAVHIGGNIGFIGFAIPHLLRLCKIADNYRLLLGSVILGGCLLVNADSVARTVVDPQQLPVGSITALLGIVLILIMLFRKNHRAI